MPGEDFSVISEEKALKRIEFYEDLFKSDRLVSMSGSELLSLGSKFSKIEDVFALHHKDSLVTKRIGILSSTTTHHLVTILKLFLFQRGIRPLLYEGEYDGIGMELMNPDSGIFAFNPELVLLLTYHTDIKEYPDLFSSDDEIAAWVEMRVHYYRGLWNLARGMSGRQVFQTLFVPPLERQLGNLEGNYSFSRSNCLRALNRELIRQKPPYVTFLDFDYIASALGKERWFDESNYFMSKQGFSFEAAGRVCCAVSRIVAAQAGKVKKCLVLDLDNTLWGGVIGDDGLEGININPNNALGESFLAFQKYVKSLKERGVILAVCSKNDEDTARTPFEEHPEMILRLDDIACFMANWNDKSTNLRALAEQLNLGLDSFVFFDDNPAEREIVRQFLPDVEVVDVPEDPALYVRALEAAQPFEWVQLSREDTSRSESYITDRKRKELEMVCIDYDSYLTSLDMRGNVGIVTTMEAPRFVQLINKTNQFNLRTRRYTDGQVEQINGLKDQWALLHISLVDRFVNYGIISAVILEKIGDKAFIDTWVMSCRVLKRDVEKLAMNAIIKVATLWGCEWIVGEYVGTKKNGMVRNLYGEFGFETCSNGWFSPVDPDGVLFRRRVSDCVPLRHHIDETVRVEHL